MKVVPSIPRGGVLPTPSSSEPQPIQSRCLQSSGSVHKVVSIVQTRLPEAPSAAEPESEPFRTRIGGQVLKALGEPTGLRSVDVRRLWGLRFRVNVLVGRDAASVSVAHSYFLETNSAGDIVSTTPEISRRY